MNVATEDMEVLNGRKKWLGVGSYACEIYSHAPFHSNPRIMKISIFIHFSKN